MESTTNTKNEKKDTKDTTAADRYTLDFVRESEEMLIGMGKLSPEAIEQSQALRASVGAKPLRLDDARVWNRGSVAARVDFSPEEVKGLREREGASQAVMAAHLGITTTTLSRWERGERKPDGSAAKLLALVQAHGLGYISA